MREQDEKWQADIDCVQSVALAAYKRKQDGDTIGMHHYLRHAREMMRLLHVDIPELIDQRAINMLSL